MVDRVLHLALFISAGIAFAVAALAILERVTASEDRSEPTIRIWHIAMPIAVFAAIGIAERVYHLVHQAS